jgi:biopolymer transport protein ExbD
MPRKKSRQEPESIHLGFQIAPMIDIVFVIMLFFMVQAAYIQVEQELNLKLPGKMVSGEPIAIEETQVHVLFTGEVLLNDDPIGAAEDKKLREFSATMVRLAQASIAAKTELVVSIMADEDTPYQRVIDVLNAMSVAKVQKVTFEVPME